MPREFIFDWENMEELLSITVNGSALRVPAGTSIAAAILRAGVPSRISVTGTPRAPLCGMGICFECRARVDGVPHRRTCQLFCADGMAIETQE